MHKSDVLAHFGTLEKVAIALTGAGYRISRQAVGKWGPLIPLDRAYQLEGVTDGVLVVRMRLYELDWARRGRSNQPAA